MPIDRQLISAIVLAGGRGSRMGGVDKGLENHHGVPLALHALLRLAPQVGPLMVNANRNIAAYEALGSPVWPDTVGDFAGPLAGFLVGLEHCETPYLMTVPCDSPDFPPDLVQRLADALDAENADSAVAATTAADGSVQAQPVFCLMKAQLLEALTPYLMSGGRKIDHWTATHRSVLVPFTDASAFANANTREELMRLQAQRPHAP